MVADQFRNDDGVSNPIRKFRIHSRNSRFAEEMPPISCRMVHRSDNPLHNRSVIGSGNPRSAADKSLHVRYRYHRFGVPFTKTISIWPANALRLKSITEQEQTA